MQEPHAGRRGTEGEAHGHVEADLVDIADALPGQPLANREFVQLTRILGFPRRFAGDAFGEFVQFCDDVSIGIRTIADVLLDCYLVYQIDRLALVVRREGCDIKLSGQIGD